MRGHRPYGILTRGGGGGDGVVGPVDKRVHDDDVIAEIQLTADLMIAASEHDGPLTEAELDALLGLR